MHRHVLSVYVAQAAGREWVIPLRVAASEACSIVRLPTGGIEMTEAEYRLKLDDLDRILNDPDVPLDAGRVWSLLFEAAPYTTKFRNEAEQACGSRR
jgi:hypothetical protein